MSTNDSGHDIRILIAGTAADEMNAMDQLGPLTRRAIHNAPIRYAALAIMMQIREVENQQRARFPEHVRHLVHIDPKDPKLDANIAHGLREDSIATVLRDRSQFDADIGVKPIVAKVSVKSIREQRRSLRKVRW
jgi:hypothetical protein